MEIPNLCKGYYYPSARSARCPMFHRCTVTNKCQNYDRHNLQCNLCEEKSNMHEVDPDGVPLGGHLAEGEFYPDLQDAFGYLERMIGSPFAHPDAEPQKFNKADIARKHDKETRVVEMIRLFSSLGKLKMEETIENVMVDPEVAKHLGRIY